MSEKQPSDDGHDEQGSAPMQAADDKKPDDEGPAIEEAEEVEEASVFHKVDFIPLEDPKDAGEDDEEEEQGQDEGDANKVGDDEEDEVDYMTMVIENPKESATRQANRKKQQTYDRAHPKSDAVLRARGELTSKQKRFAASMSKPLDESNKGFRMLKSMGFAGGALGSGKNADAITAPLAPTLRDARDHGGVGIEESRKREFQEQLDAIPNAKKQETGEWREQLAKERKDQQVETEVKKAMRATRGLDIERYGEELAEAPSKQVNKLWRQLVVEDEMRAASRQEKHTSYESRYEDSTLAQLVRQENALAHDPNEIDLGLDTSDEAADKEFQQFLELPPEDRLQLIIDYQRREHNYCHWCMTKYEDAEQLATQCPGDDEDSHG